MGVDEHERYIEEVEAEQTQGFVHRYLTVPAERDETDYG